MHAHRFTQPACAEVGGTAKKHHPEQTDAGYFQGQQLGGQWPDGGEIADEGQRGHHTDRQPQRVLGRTPGNFVDAPGRGLQFDALVSIAFSDFFTPHKQPGPDALRAGVAAPHSASKHRDRKQAKGRDDQQRRQQDEILRPERRAENMELALGQVPKHRLTAIPMQPGRAEKK